MSVVSAGAPGGSRLGRSGESDIPTPVEIDTNGIVCLGVGWRHNIVIYEDGTALGWGNNEDDQLGIKCRETLKPEPLEIFHDCHLSWVHCGDKITVVLTDSGDVYAIGSSYGKFPVRLKAPNPAVFCTCGVGTVYAIDSNGDIFVCASSVGSGSLYHLPEPVCDIAAGNTFCLAVTISGKAYARGNDAACGCSNNHPGENFAPITSLAGIPVSRVFAYCSHSVVLARDGRVFVCGTNNDGRIGLVATQPQSNFQPLHFFDDMHVAEVDCGDSHTLFVTEEGDVYGCGVSDDGRTFTGKSPSVKTPVKSLPLGGRASFVRCGCFHSVALVDIRRPVHPGLLFFGLLVGSMRKPKYIKISPDLTVDIALGSITGTGFLPGDTVDIGLGKQGIVVGVVGDKICIKTQDGLISMKRPLIKFISRKNCIPRTYKTRAGISMTVDCNEDLCRCFGFSAGDTIYHRTLGSGTVVGFSNGTIWFHFESLNGAICRSKDTTLDAIHALITITETKRNIQKIKCSDGIEYPIEPLNCFNVRTKDSFGEVVGEIGAFYCVRDYFGGNYKLFLKKSCHVTKCFEEFRQFDHVLTGECEGTLIDCAEKAAFVLSEENLITNNPPQLYNTNMTLIIRVVGSGTTKINGDDIDVSACIFDRSSAMPGDVFATSKGFVRIIGKNKEGTIMCTHQLDIKKNDFSLEEFESDKAVLVRRTVLKADRVCKMNTGGSIQMSIYVPSFAGLYFLPGDELLIDDKNYVVFGCVDQYLLIQSLEEQGVQYYDPSKGRKFPIKAELVARPTTHFDIFLD